MRSLIKLFIPTILFVFSFSSLIAQCPSFVKIANSNNGHHILAIKSDGTLWAWGTNFTGQIGDGTTTDRSTPIQIGTANDWIDIAVGSYHSLAVKSDGTLWAWGFNSWYSLGDGTNVSKSTPTQIGTATNWQSVAAGDVASFAITNTGKLFGWGYNGYGELGDGTTISRTTPTALSPSRNFIRVTSGKYHSLGITDDHKLWAWGANNLGQLGDATIISKLSPVNISPSIDWQDIACGYDASAGVSLDGRLFAWGTNANGQIGNGTYGAGLYVDVPTQIGTGTNWTKVTVGWDHDAALTSDGKAWSWGFNGSGQLGTGGYVQVFTPTATGAAYNFTQISAGTFYTVAVTTDNQALAWGYPGPYAAHGSLIAREDIPFTINYEPNFSNLAPSGSSSTRLQTTRTHYSSSCSELIAAVEQKNHANRIDGSTTARVWIEASQPLQYVKRHYQITPDNNASNAVGRVTLYFTQSDFDDFNNQIPAPTFRLPNAPADVTGKANLRIEKRGGNSSNGTGLPETYSGAISTLDPADTDIIWNVLAGRWEISFDVMTGFSGFFIKPQNFIILPTKWIVWQAKQNSKKQAELTWKVQEQNISNYELERSETGETFEKFASIVSKGDGTNEYTYTDISGLNGGVYYRIKQIDKDGKTGYSAIIRIQSGKTSFGSLYPNPTVGEVTVEVGAELLNTEASLIDLHGKKLSQFKVKSIQFTLDLSKYSPGVYFLRTADGDLKKILLAKQ